MIEFKQGNILDATENIICQQVNCRNVMGAGLAKQIRQKWPIVYDKYLESRKVLGNVQLVNVDCDKYVANIFAQENYGNNGRYTNYEAFYNALELLAKTTNHNHSLAFPYGIGSGLAGGNWDIIFTMISVVLKNRDVIIYNRE